MGAWRCSETGTEWDGGADDAAVIWCEKCSAAGCPNRVPAPDARLVTGLDAATLTALVTGAPIPEASKPDGLAYGAVPAEYRAGPDQEDPTARPPPVPVAPDAPVAADAITEPDAATITAG